MPDDDLARFLRRVFFVREDPRQRIAENGKRFGEAYSVLPQVGSVFARVPFEYLKASGLIPEYARMGVSEEVWLGRRDSNPDTQIQSLQSYR